MGGHSRDISNSPVPPILARRYGEDRPMGGSECSVAVVLPPICTASVVVITVILENPCPSIIELMQNSQAFLRFNSGKNGTFTTIFPAKVASDANFKIR